MLMLSRWVLFSIALYHTLVLPTAAGALCFFRHFSCCRRHFHHHQHHHYASTKWAGRSLTCARRSGLFIKSLESSSSCLDQTNHHYADDTEAALVTVSGNLTVLQYCDGHYNNNISNSDTSSACDDDSEHLLSYAVIDKPPSVICHHSEWAGSRRGQTIQVPMLQRIRQAFGGRRVNLIHRLDRGCSGCLLVTFAQDDDNNNIAIDTSSSSTTTTESLLMMDEINEDKQQETTSEAAYYTAVTRRLIQAMNHSRSQKTYIALVRGEGILHGRDFKQEGWFKVDRAIKNENGILRNATTWFRFVAGQPSLVVDDKNNNHYTQQPRASLVLARPETGRWHQIRRHLNGLSHPILGDSTHGNSQINREFRALYGMLPERTCLHLARLQLCLDNDDDADDESVQKQAGSRPASDISYDIDVTCPLSADMMRMLHDHMPNLLREARPILEQEGIFGVLDDNSTHKNAFKVLPYTVRVPAS
jgi:23S rRNA-/tRNA-specific pseudouridylate synthase